MPTSPCTDLDACKAAMATVAANVNIVLAEMMAINSELDAQNAHLKVLYAKWKGAAWWAEGLEHTCFACLAVTIFLYVMLVRYPEKARVKSG